MKTALSAYVESSISTADPLELVRMLYRAAIASVEDARLRLSEGDIAGRSKAITKCYEIVAELSSSLNHEVGGELSRNLARLYEYIQHLLLEANIKQADPPLAEVLRLLCTLSSGWESIESPHPQPAVAEERNQPRMSASPWQGGYTEELAAAHSWNG